MYIPKPALEDCLTSEISASGGDVMYDYITGSQIRRVHYFRTTGSHEFEVHEGCNDSTQLFLVGGGGAGGFGERRTTGSGGPYFLPAPSSYISCLNTTTQTAGGGGGGGILFINADRELTGSLALVPRKYPIHVGAGGGMTLTTDGTTNVNSSGEDTTFQYAYRIANDADIPSGSATSSRYEYDSITIKGGGGGAGGTITWAVLTGTTDCGNTDAGPQWYQITTNGVDGGSGGGGPTTFCGGDTIYAVGGSGSNIYPYGNQGGDGEWYYSPGPGHGTLTRGYNGGAGTGNDGTYGPEYIRGYSQPFAYGGKAQNAYTCGTPDVVVSDRGLTWFTYSTGSDSLTNPGRGGHAYVWDFTSSYIESVQDSYWLGLAGEAYVTYALTGSQLTNGKLHYIDGGVSGGIFTFIPCGEVRVETLTVPAGKQACICAMDTGLDLYLGGSYKEAWWDNIEPPLTGSDILWEPYKSFDQLPSGSGTVTFTTGSSCHSYVPFEGWDTCGSCAQNAPGGIYIGFDISGSSGRTNPLPYYKYPDTTIHWTSSQNYITSSRYNNHDSESYYQTRIGAFSNDYDDDIAFSNFEPSASFSTSYVDQNVDFTTGSQCFTYYECDPLDFQPITASGGTEGTFVSGSWIYKYHIFEPSASSNEFYTRSFQELSIVGGYSDDINMLVIGPGGPGGPATGSDSGRIFYGGGGGAGQLKQTKVLDICSNYTLHIAPGLPYGTLEGSTPTPDVWQETYGQTIVSASDASLYISSGMGGRGSAPITFGGNDTMNDWNDRSGSGGGGAAIEAIGPGGYITGGYDTQQTDGGDGYDGTGSAGGGGGAAEAGYDGTGGATAKGGEGGDGIRLNYDGVLRYYGGGGAGYGPGGAANGGLGGGGNSGIGLSTGSFYGAGGGAWIGPSQGATTPFGFSYIVNGIGGDGAVIINYKWKFNTSPSDNIVIRGLSQFYDMYDTNSYDGTGSLVYSLWNEGTASLGNVQGWEYNTTVLDGSGSLEVVTSSLHPYVTTEPTSSTSISVLQTWFSNNVIYDASSSSYPIISDEQFGTSSFGMYAGDDTTYGEAVVIKIGDTEIATESGSAGNFVPRGGFHISQFSYNQTTNELLWYVDGYSGSATVNEDIDIRDITLSFNSSSLVSYPDGNPTYPSASQATEYEVQMLNDSFSDFTFTFVVPQTGEVVSRTTNDYSNQPRYRFASTTTPVITEGSGSITSGSVVDYYPSSSIYNGRTSQTSYRRPGGSYLYYIDTFYNVTTCQWTTTDYYANVPRNRITTAAQNSFYTLPSYDTNVTQSFTGFNDCIYRPPVGLGDDSTYNLTAIYTASLTWEEMRHNDDYLYPRY